MQLQWRAHIFPPETDQKCVALHHWTAKAALSGPHVSVCVIDEFARREARKVAISIWSPERVNIISSS